MKDKRIFILLSSKSAGSTAFQSFLHVNYGIKIVRHTEHFESETLYWTKAASILGLPQAAMHRSVVPYSKAVATSSLQKFLLSNGVNADLPSLTKRDLFELFFQLADRTGTLFIEKSPHHLYNESNVQLILEFKEYIKDRATVILLGLVRNPLDTIYSAWNRWGYNCLAFEEEWTQSYRNLKQLADDSVDIMIMRYEDLIASTDELDRYLTSHCGLKSLSTSFKFNSDSVGRWKLVPRFGHRLGKDAIQVAGKFGYDQGIVNSNTPSIAWGLSENYSQLKFYGISIRKRLKRIISRV